jgi:uncharacterized membrane protein
MSQQSSSAQLNSTWGKFSNKKVAEVTQAKLQEAGIAPEKITLETEDSLTPIKLEETQAISNLKFGAIAGSVLGFLVGLSISLIMTNFANEGLAALRNFQTIHYFAPILGAIVGAVGISLISGVAGGNVPQSNVDVNNNAKSKRYLILVEGTAAETSLAKEIFTQQGGILEEADRR